MYICRPFLKTYAKVAQLVEHDLAKVGVAGSNPVFRSLHDATQELHLFFARVVELVDTLDLKSNGHCVRAGSSPAPGTKGLLSREDLF